MSTLDLKGLRPFAKELALAAFIGRRVRILMASERTFTGVLTDATESEVTLEVTGGGTRGFPLAQLRSEPPLDCQWFLAASTAEELIEALILKGYK